MLDSVGLHKFLFLRSC